MRWLVGLLLMGGVAAGQDGQAYVKALREQAAADRLSEEVAVEASTQPGAVWVGDRLVFGLQFRLAPDLELHLDDLDAGFLEGAGWEVLDQRIERSQSATGETTYRIEFDLTTFELGPGQLEIPSLEVRYFRAGAPVGTDLESGRVSTKTVRVPLRSTLPEEDVVQSIRSLELPSPVPAGVLGRWLGLALMLAGLALAATVFAGRFRSDEEDSEWAPTVVVGDWSTLEALPVEEIGQRREAYTQLDRLLRSRLTGRIEASVPACTVDELTDGLEEADSEFVELLRQCERGKYAREPMVPDAEAWRQDLGRARRLGGAA